MYFQEKKMRKNIGGAELTTNEVDTTTWILLHGYRNRNICGRTLQQLTSGNATTPTAEKPTTTEKVINGTKETNNWKKGEGKNS